MDGGETKEEMEQGALWMYGRVMGPKHTGFSCCSAQPPLGAHGSRHLTLYPRNASAAYSHQQQSTY